MQKKTGIIIGVIAAVIIAVSGITVFASGSISKSNAISAETACNFAFVDAGITPEEANVTKAKYEYDNGRFVYDIEFYTEKADYDYKVDARNGVIVEKEITAISIPTSDRDISSETKADKKKEESTTENETTKRASTTQTRNISLEEAKAIALKDAGLNESDVIFSKAKKEVEDGKTVFDINFYIQGQTEYEYEIDADDGTIRERSVEAWEADDYYIVDDGYSAPSGGRDTSSSVSGQNSPASASEQNSPAPASSTPEPAAPTQPAQPAQEVQPAAPAKPAQPAAQPQTMVDDDWDDDGPDDDWDDDWDDGPDDDWDDDGPDDDDDD